MPFEGEKRKKLQHNSKRLPSIINIYQQQLF